MRDIAMEIGNSIRRRREILGVLQPTLSSLSGVSMRTIQMVEQGKGNPSLRTLLRLAEPLGLTLELLLRKPGKDDTI
jgi:transcriptional regulator with XRE-family HTH domain